MELKAALKWRTLWFLLLAVTAQLVIDVTNGRTFRDIASATLMLFVLGWLARRIYRRRKVTRYIEHTIGTPLTLMTGYIQMLRDGDVPITPALIGRMAQANADMKLTVRLLLEGME